MAIQTSDGQNIPATTGVGSILDVAASGLPFRFELSLEPLIRFWTRGADEGGACGAISRLVNEEVRKAPELLGVIQDPAVLQRHRDLLATQDVRVGEDPSRRYDDARAASPAAPEPRNGWADRDGHLLDGRLESFEQRNLHLARDASMSR